MKKNIILCVMGVLLIASLITNFILVKKLNAKEQTIVEKPVEETLKGVYYNQKGTIELLDNNKCMYLYKENYDCTYTVKENKISFHYYVDPHYEKQPDGKCYGYNAEEITNIEIPCIEEHNIEGTVVNNGIIVNNNMYSKVG